MARQKRFNTATTKRIQHLRDEISLTYNAVVARSTHHCLQATAYRHSYVCNLANRVEQHI